MVVLMILPISTLIVLVQTSESVSSRRTTAISMRTLSIFHLDLQFLLTDQDISALGKTTKSWGQVLGVMGCSVLTSGRKLGTSWLEVGLMVVVLLRGGYFKEMYFFLFSITLRTDTHFVRTNSIHHTF